jgi:hypothetical protein
MEERYARQTMLPEIGERGQRRLSEASVLIVGIGGLGSAAALYLTGAGVGRIGLADADTVSKSNLQRQVLYTEGQVGMPKSAAARERLVPHRVRMLAGGNYSGKRTAYSGRLRPDTRLLRQLSDPLPARRCMRCLPKTLGTRLDRGVLRSGDRFQRSERPSLQRSLSRPGGPLCPSPDHAGRTRHSAGCHRNAASLRGDQISLRLRRAARRAAVHDRPAYPANPNHRLLTCKNTKRTYGKRI